jgi:hypothetical protein
MPGSSTTPGRLDARFHAPTRVAFRIRRDKNFCGAQWLACVFLYRRFAAALTGDCARLEADVVSYAFILSDLHRLLVAGLPAHCERFCTSCGLRPDDPLHVKEAHDPIRLGFCSILSICGEIYGRAFDRLPRDSRDLA